ncbi:MAG: UdgX family uracil-DNA binding protein [Planctomycetota bacterium]
MLHQPADFEDFRSIARDLIVRGIHPRDVMWGDRNAGGMTLFDDASLFHESASAGPASPTDTDSKSPRPAFTVPKRYLEVAHRASHHRSTERWELLYRVLYRITHGEAHLMRIETDDDVDRMIRMDKAVRRDAHKMKAFVRFREVESPAGDIHFVAWHRPDHYIVPLVAPFFSRRFIDMRWTILTPNASVRWDGETLHYGPGATSDEAPSDDRLEHLWLTYYASIFNPARVKVKAMKAEMPVKHWPTLPETRLIPDLLEQAGSRVEEMVKNTEGLRETAASVLPERRDLGTLAAAASTCRACPLCGPATQTVFGEGNADASLVLVGEQPGDQEDLAGRPFVGPAGELLAGVLAAAGVPRESAYITNVVKHFKFVQRGKRRLHQKPNSREIFACRPWLEAELEQVQPRVLVCLGATAAQAILGRDFRITVTRGQFRASPWCDQTLATWHPAAVLRMQDPGRRQAMRQEMVRDLELAKATLVA